MWSTIATLDADHPAPLLGHPLRNTTVYILDRYLQPVPAGVAGELYIGGAGVARGYWNRPDLTADRFIPDPFSSAPGQRLYRTGDLVRRQRAASEDPSDSVRRQREQLEAGDGSLLPRAGNPERDKRDTVPIIYLGRADHQVKLRGHRIELGEIEARLLADDQVRAAAVILREDSPGDPRLVAYVVPAAGMSPAARGQATRGIDERGEEPRRADPAGVADRADPEVPRGIDERSEGSRRADPAGVAERDVPRGIDPARLQNVLRQTLPEYMIPPWFVVLDALPLSVNGKLDRKALPVPDLAPRSGDLVAPRDDLERRLVALWQEVLGLDTVGIHDSFFDLGGHSLSATRLASRIREVLAIELPLRVVFEAASVARLADVLRTGAFGAISDDEVDAMSTMLDLLENPE